MQMVTTRYFSLLLRQIVYIIISNGLLIKDLEIKLISNLLGHKLIICLGGGGFI